MSAEDVSRSALEIIGTYTRLGLKIVTAESCTGGMVASALTAIAGSSAVLERGFVTYSNEAKAEMLGVPPALIAQHGAVSEAVARAMAEGALQNSRADISVAITGIAGPAGGSVSKPVGLVHFASAIRGAGTRHVAQQFGNPGRDQVRLCAVLTALDLLAKATGENR
ncbi:MAG: CinA family protein [Hyphomicrobiales bacterium]